jgi:hypothetical protein
MTVSKAVTVIAVLQNYVKLCLIPSIGKKNLNNNNNNNNHNNYNNNNNNNNNNSEELMVDHL